MERVALINPGKNKGVAYQEPLNLGFLASYLEANNVEVLIIDELIGQNVEEELIKFCPDLVGITATTPFAPDAYRVADLCKKKGILTVMGGVHASLLPDEALLHVDFVVKGEGEIAMLDIARNNNVNSKIISRPYIKNIDEIPPPARHLMNMNFYLYTKDRNPDSYLYFVPPNTPTASILTSRGCPYNCTFCHNSWRGTPTRYNSAERVIAEIQELIEVYGIRALFFIEDNLFANKKRLKTICEMMKQNKIDIIWGGNARVDNVDMEILQIVKDAGCRQITFGFESGSQRILDILNKKTTVEQNRRAIELCNQIGIIPQGTFMIGNPTETVEDIKSTKKFIEDNDIESAGVCLAIPYPGTDMWTWCVEQKLIPDSLKWEDFTFDKVPINVCNTVSPEELRKQQFEINRITFFRKKTRLKFSKLMYDSIQHPDRAITMIVSIFKKPLAVPELIKRVRF
jgi:magnesium-protoporphyrin IX monomethyl ester (oxidative) cyclase